MALNYTTRVNNKCSADLFHIQIINKLNKNVFRVLVMINIEKQSFAGSPNKHYNKLFLMQSMRSFR